MATLTFHIPSDVRKKLEKVAKREDRSMGAVVRRAINADLEQRSKKALA